MDRIVLEKKTGGGFTGQHAEAHTVAKFIEFAAGGDAEKALAQLDETEKAVRRLAEKPAGRRAQPACDAALLYTRGLVHSESKDPADLAKGLAHFEKYLDVASPQSLYWPTAYARYEAVCKSLKQEPKPKEKFGKARAFKQRLVTGIKLANGSEITLGDDREDLEKKLGPGKPVRVLSTQNIWRIRYEAEGVEILAADTVLAIGMTGPTSPAVPIRGQGIGARETGLVKVGMSVDELEKLLGEDYQPCEITAVDVYYRYYRDQGLAVRLKNGLVTEVLIVQLPKSGGP